MQNISDDVGYLDSIGRKQRVELLRDARIAEAETKAESAIQTAENEKITALKRIERDVAISQAEADRRIQNALTQRTAVVAEAEAEIAAEVARAEADIPVQQERIKQVKQQLQADVVAPAEANCKQAIAQARARAAKIVENGRAQAEGTRRLVQSWQAAGPMARDIFLLQKLDVLLELLAGTVPEVHVDNVTVIDPANTGAVGSLISGFEQLKYSTGIDVAGIASRVTGEKVEGDRPISVTEIPPKAESPAPVQAQKAAVPAAASTGKKSSGDKPKPALSPLSAETMRQLQREVRPVLDQVASMTASGGSAEAALSRYLDTQPRLKRKLQRAFQAGGQAALDVLFEHPVVKISSRIMGAWLQ